MRARYYRIVPDPRCSDRWFLASPETAAGVPVDPRDFTEAKTYDRNDLLLLPLRRAGRPVAFNFADFDMPVVRRDIAECIEAMGSGAVQRLPVMIETAPHFIGDYEILNVLATACLDEERSTIMWWTAEDGRPDKVGCYRMVTDLSVDPARVGPGKMVFRITGWEIALVVHDSVRLALEASRVTGISFQAV